METKKDLASLLIEAQILCQSASDEPWSYELSPYADENNGYRIGNQDSFLGLLHNKKDAEFVVRSRTLISDLIRAFHEEGVRFENCHIWEPGENISTIANQCEVLIRAEELRNLIQMGPRSANEPLTLSELRQLEGTAVWCCYKKDNKDVVDFRLVSPGAFGCIGIDELYLLFREYGETWIAYRDKPERKCALHNPNYLCGAIMDLEETV